MSKETPVLRKEVISEHGEPEYVLCKECSCCKSALDVEYVYVEDYQEWLTDNPGVTVVAVSKDNHE